MYQPRNAPPSRPAAAARINKFLRGKLVNSRRGRYPVDTAMEEWEIDAGNAENVPLPGPEPMDEDWL